MFETLKRVFVGRPLATSEQEHQRLIKVIALAVFSSDAISSTAYGTEEILFVTTGGGSSLQQGLAVLVPISIAVAILLAIVITSYRQTIFAYPSGGGSYVVSRENLGEAPSLVAGASLLVDYILTVAVSISAGTAALISIPQFRDLAEYRVVICLGLIAFITLMNLRGVKESGRIFAVPTYVYIVALAGLIGYGLLRTWGVGPELERIAYDADLSEAARETGGSLGLFLVLRGFASGAVALTGVEAISNGVPAFRRPESKNAATTLVWMGLILGSLFFGVSVLAHRIHPFPSHDITVNAQLAAQIFNEGSFLYWVLQLSTAGILVLAANTAYADYPRLSGLIAQDGYLPRQFANRGDRLVFSNGILVLAVGAGALIVAFGGVTTALIPLYAVGVFTSFTLSQTGMVVHHLKAKERGWQRNVVINGVGGFATFVVLMIVAITKFTQGAWLPLVVIPVIMVAFKAVHRHYQGVAAGLRLTPEYRTRKMNHTVVVLVGSVHRGAMEALAYARSMRPNQILAVTVVSDEEQEDRIARAWAERKIDIPLEIVHSPYRELTAPILRFIDELDAQRENDIITVVIPEFVVKSWWGQLLHNQSALVLKGRLLFRKGTVVTSVPYHLE